MEYNKKEVSIVNDDPCEGKVFVFPQCTTCAHCKGKFCEAFGKDRLEIIADKDTDLFNCPKFKSQY